ncbi:histidine--tRNA ligase [Desulfonauticus submarinus]
MNKITKIKGFADLFPPESTVYVKMEETARQVFSAYGCNEVRIPIVEKTELFARTIGGETDIVQKEMYTFQDRKGRSLTLRPEATAGMVRAFIESGPSQGSIAKYFTLGPMFRYERPQKGRMRQFHQIDVEFFGPTTPQADGELILMLWHYLTALKLDNFHLEINSLGCPKCRPQFKQKLLSFLQNIDESKLCADCKRRKQTNPLRVLDCKVSTCKEMVASAPKIIDSLCLECQKHFKDVLAILDKAGLNYTLNHLLVRGLDYYQRTTFEIIAENPNIGSQSAIAGGGRYDGLVKNLGGPDIPGLGFACGMERIALLLDKQNNFKQDFFLAVLSDKALNQAILLAQKLRNKGFKGEVSFEAKSLKSQLRYAHKKEVKTCLILGEDELSSGVIQAKNMETGLQQTIALEDIEQALGINF